MFLGILQRYGIDIYGIYFEEYMPGYLWNRLMTILMHRMQTPKRNEDGVGHKMLLSHFLKMTDTRAIIWIICLTLFAK